jgi:hypothetical protein
LYAQALSTSNDERAASVKTRDDKIAALKADIATLQAQQQQVRV